MKRINWSKELPLSIGKTNNFIESKLATFQDALQNVSLRFESLSEVHHGELCCVPQLVAEEPVALDAEHVEVDVSA